MSPVKKICICGIFIALCYVLPVAFHAVGLGGVLSPMHIPVLLCGMICGGAYGAFCGLAGPVLSSLLSGMPPTTGLISMVPELMVYGLVSGLCMRFICTKSTCANIYISLVTAMVLGRVAGGIAKALFYLGTGKSFGIMAWATGYFVTSLPGIVVHLILIPTLMLVLYKSGVISNRISQQT